MDLMTSPPLLFRILTSSLTIGRLDQNYQITLEWTLTSIEGPAYSYLIHGEEQVPNHKELYNFSIAIYLPLGAHFINTLLPCF